MTETTPAKAEDANANKTALCKFRGMLVMAVFSKCEDGKHGSCPECGSAEFSTHAGWVECDCGFAIDEAAYNRILAT